MGSTAPSLVYSPNIYTPLDNDTEEHIFTRAIYVLPDLTPDGHIRCVTVPLCVNRNGAQEAPGAYVALSYVWGSDAETSLIQLNGRYHAVRKSLNAFLFYVRRKMLFGSAYWIDALCINQADILERNRLVKRMGLIYNKALCTLIWLGVEKDLVRLDRFFETTHRYYEGCWKEHLQDLDQELDVVAFQKVCRAYSFTFDQWLADWTRLVGDRYWWRVWTQQEFLLAAQLRICTESGPRTLEHFWIVSHLVFGHCLSRDLPVAKKYGVQPALFGLWNKWKIEPIGIWGGYRPEKAQRTTEKMAKTPKMHTKRPLPMWFDSVPLDCEDVKDQIYGQLSRVLRGETFPVDYSESVMTLFVRVLLFCAQEHWFCQQLPLYFAQLAKILAIDMCEMQAYSDNSKYQGAVPNNVMRDARSAVIDFRTSNRVSAWESDRCCMVCSHCERLIKSFDRPTILSHYCCMVYSYEMENEDFTLNVPFHLSFDPDQDETAPVKNIYFHSTVAHGCFSQDANVSRDKANRMRRGQSNVISLNITTCIWLVQLLARLSKLEQGHLTYSPNEKTQAACGRCSSPTISGLNAIHYSHPLLGMQYQSSPTDPDTASSENRYWLPAEIKLSDTMGVKEWDSDYELSNENILAMEDRL